MVWQAMAITKGKRIVDGGEGYIYEAKGNPDLLIKIYKEKDMSGAPIVTPELKNKLEYMKDNPPDVLVSKGIVAWPVELINDDNGNLQGFTMPRMDFDEHIQRTYSYRHPVLEADEYKRFPSVESRIKIAMNLCSALNELHRKGYVFGDLNHHNVGVNYSTGQICFMDCDSLHLTTDFGDVFRTSVIMAGYLAPEIIRHCNNERSHGREYNLDKVALPTFTKESDLFCLSVHIFKLLMNGVSPFLGIKTDAAGSTASPFVGNDAIERNAYVFREGNKPSAVFCLPADSLPFEIITLLNRAFMDGSKVSYLRPHAADLYNALNRYLTSGLTQCKKEPKHQYFNQLSECPYCAADNRHQAQMEGLPVHAFERDTESLPILPIDQPSTQRQQTPVQQPASQSQSSPQSTQQHAQQSSPFQKTQSPWQQTSQQTAQQPPAAKRTTPAAGTTTTTPAAGIKTTSHFDIFTRIKNGETTNLQFGKYTWQVLDKKWDKALLLTEKTVGLKPYNIKPKNITWETSSLRDYLNIDFMQSCFTNKQIASIIFTKVLNTRNTWCGTSGGKDSYDYIFLLNIDEANSYFSKGSQYQNNIVVANWFVSNSFDKKRAAQEPWWLRSPGGSKNYASYVTDSGSIDIIGHPVNSLDIGVRPALWLSLN